MLFNFRRSHGCRILELEYIESGDSSDGRILWVEVLDSTGTQNSDGVTKIGGAIVSQVKNARNCGKYGENVISSIKNSGFTTAEVNAQISKFSKLGCTQSTIETLLKDAKCMFLGDDTLNVISKSGSLSDDLAKLVLNHDDDFSELVITTFSNEGITRVNSLVVLCEF